MNSLEIVIQRLFDVHGVHVFVAAELEWYLRPKGTDVPWAAKYTQLQKYFSALYDACASSGIDLHSHDEESGAGQVEVALPPTKKPQELIDALRSIKVIAAAVAEDQNLIADFSAKPYANDYGSGLHIHVHLEDEVGNNLYSKREDEMSSELRDSLAGLLHTMPENMGIYAPEKASWQRFEPKYNAPVNPSWGTNNRTVALRLPDNVAEKSGIEDIAAMPFTFGRRIEHRVSGADANPEAVILAVLEGIDYGLTQKPSLAEPIYGDASDEQYNLTTFQKD